MANTRRKKYIIKSRVRFTIFIIVVITFLATAVTTVTGFNDAEGMTKQTYIKVRVEPGDTLWSIADQYMPQDMDRRQSVHIISQINQTSASQLYAGQVLSIPIEI